MPPEGEYFRPEGDALELHSIATKLHRWAERECSEDLACPVCEGNGQHEDLGRKVKASEIQGRLFHAKRWREDAEAETGIPCPVPPLVECASCAGTGSRLGKRAKLNEDRAVAIAARYGLRVYFQSDCRGCPLYLIPNEETRPDESHYSSTGVAVCWLG